MKKNTSRVSDKCRNFNLIIYPENIENENVLALESCFVTACENGQLIKYAISPLHDRDLMENGAQKKPHYHIILAFNYPLTIEGAYNKIRALTEFVLLDTWTNNLIQFCNSYKNSYAYLTHLNAPDKPLYPAEFIRTNSRVDVGGSPNPNIGCMLELNSFIDSCNHNVNFSFILQKYGTDVDMLKFLYNKSALVSQLIREHNISLFEK